MKYSIRGSLNTADGSGVVDAINNYNLWRFVTYSGTDENGNPIFTFESWVNVLTDKDSLWTDLKSLVDTHTGSIDWHECTHDEPNPQPCTVVETYRK